MTFVILKSGRSDEIAARFWRTRRSEAVQIFRKNKWLAFESRPATEKVPVIPFMHYAVMIHSDELIEGGLAQGAPLECKGPVGRTVLGTLLEEMPKGSEEGRDPERWMRQVDMMLEAGAKCDVVDGAGSPLWLARGGEIPQEIFKKLLANGAPLDGFVKGGLPWLTRIIVTGSDVRSSFAWDNAKHLVEMGANVNLFEGNDVGTSALGVLADFHDTEMQDLLLAHGVDVSVRDDQGRGLLHLDVSPQMVRLLVENGASVDAADNRGWTPMMEAFTRGEKSGQSIVAFLAAGADVECPYPGEHYAVRDVIGWRADTWPYVAAALAARDARRVANSVLAEIEVEQRQQVQP